jgi:hypothetical protein
MVFIYVTLFKENQTNQIRVIDLNLLNIRHYVFISCQVWQVLLVLFPYPIDDPH